jgi:hypothetical protein
MIRSVFRQWQRPLVCIAVVLVSILMTHPADAGHRWQGSAGATGGWRGQWQSQTSGHRGPLGARIRQTGPDQYTALFYGRFAGVIPFAYRAPLNRVPGTADLYYSSKRMPLLGTYETMAWISNGQFRADFIGRQDRGIFTMTRRR